ncbi:hypothetical protein F4561_002699 [Lipingzhangella halophila]|uniref:Uncharacterized protein n=1 Tax=Lipingzhangella halophila TaxID=1783352 RepID=A0A7W7RH56_9ACTN|nr:hypothetical protein [Lipingzhangella halophila]MBB4931879.1 hypothetical protein [Lipingzhangella halophila]
MSGDVVAAIDAALVDNTVSPDAMRHAPDVPEPKPLEFERFSRELTSVIVHFERLTAQVDTTALNQACNNFAEAFRRAGEQMQAGGGLFKGFVPPQLAIFDEATAPKPLVTYEPDGESFFVPYRAGSAITMEAPGE